MLCDHGGDIYKNHRSGHSPMNIVKNNDTRDHMVRAFNICMLRYHCLDQIRQQRNVATNMHGVWDNIAAFSGLEAAKQQYKLKMQEI